MLGVKKALEIAKPFTVSRKKYVTRPILQYALVTPQYVIATDAHRLIRIQHGETMKASYLYDYKAKKPVYEADRYPITDRMFPDVTNAQAHFTIDVKEWRQIHELAAIAAKPLKEKTTVLKDNEIQVDAPGMISFKYQLEQNTGIEIAYNCEYMINVLKAYKKAKLNDVQVYYFGRLRPLYFVAEGVEVLLSPIRTDR